MDALTEKRAVLTAWRAKAVLAPKKTALKGNVSKLNVTVVAFLRTVRVFVEWRGSAVTSVSVSPELAKLATPALITPAKLIVAGAQACVL